MKKRLWVLHPLLLASTLPALAAQSDEDSIIVSANRTHRTVAEMAQTTWVIEGQEIEQQVRGRKESQRRAGAADPRHRRQQPGADQLRDEHARARDRRAD